MNIHEESAKLANDMDSTPEATAHMPDDAEIEEQPVPMSRRASLMAAVRSRTYNADLTRAHVALMEREVILPQKQLDLFRLVNRHYRTLQTWHDQYTGWRISRSSTVIRLVRHLSATPSGYVYERLRDPKDFACLTWVLWYAENRQISGRGSEQQFLLSQVAEQVQEQSTSSADSDKQFDFRKQSDRYSIQRALQYLEDLGGIQLVDGQTREWVEQTPDADVLYEFTDVTHSLVTALNPQTLEAVAARLHEASSLSTLSSSLLPGEASVTPAIVRAWRAILVGPALFRFDDPLAFAALKERAEEVASELLATYGWLLDIHRDYACIVRGHGTTTGPVTSLNMIGASDQIAMLLCGAVRGRIEAGLWPLPDAYGCLHVTTGDIEELFYSLRERYGDNWGSEARSKSSRILLQDAYKKMRQAGLIRGPDESGNILILPTAARYAVSYADPGEEAAPGRKNSKRKAKSTSNTIAIDWSD